MSLINRLAVMIQRLEHMIPALFGRYPPPDALCLAGIDVHKSMNQQPTPFTVKDLLGDGFLWAVPKHRRTIEKRMMRKFVLPDAKIFLTPKTHLRVCNTCGHHHEVGILCPTCYARIQKETELMQKKIQEKLKLNPVENEVIILYDGEKGETPSEFWKGKRIVEMEKPRPKWFSNNLMQKTTQQPATTAEVKPEELG